MQEGVQIPFVPDFPDLYLRKCLCHRMPGGFQHLECLHVQAARRQIAGRHGMAGSLQASFRQEPFMAHGGHFDIELRRFCKQCLVKLHFLRVRCDRIGQKIGDMHPGTVGIAAEGSHQRQIIRSVDSLIVLSLDQRFADTEKSFIHRVLLVYSIDTV